MSSESEKLLTEASIWLVRLERGLQPQEGAQLREWLQVPAQRDAIVALAKLHHGPDIIAVLADLVPVGFGSPAPIPRKRLKPVNVAIGVFVGLLAIAPLLLAHRYGRPRASVIEGRYRALDPVLPWGEQTYTTKFGETRTINLADGSKLILNGHTQVVVVFGIGSRQAIIKYGEAMFDIRHERQRLFDVDAGGRRFEAPVSKFDARVIGPQAVELTVLHGGITVQGLPWHWPTTPAEARLFDPHAFADAVVGPMQAAVLQDGTMNRYPISAANLRTRLSWEPQDIVYVTP